MVSQAELISKGYQPLIPGYISIILREGMGHLKSLVFLSFVVVKSNVVLDRSATMFFPVQMKKQIIIFGKFEIWTLKYN